ncbi:MAG: DUF2909 domain-containing protein [Pseudomonadota bacterium]
MTTAFKILVLLMLLGIVVSLFTSLFRIVSGGRTDSKAALRALQVRISLTVALFLLLMIGYALGIITPHGSAY